MPIATTYKCELCREFFQLSEKGSVITLGKHYARDRWVCHECQGYMEQDQEGQPD